MLATITGNAGWDLILWIIIIVLAIKQYRKS